VAALTSVSLTLPAVSQCSVKLETLRLKQIRKWKKKNECLGKLMYVYFACSTQNKTHYSFVAACRLCKGTSHQYWLCDSLLLRPTCLTAVHWRLPPAGRHARPGTLPSAWHGTPSPWAATRCRAGPAAAGVLPLPLKLAFAVRFKGA